MTEWSFPLCPANVGNGPSGPLRNLVKNLCGAMFSEGSLRNALQALIQRANGIEGVSGPNVHLTFADCRSCVNVRVEFIDRQNFPIASSTQHDDLAMLAGNVDLAVDANG